MDAFWCIVLSTIVLRWWWKKHKKYMLGKEEVEETVEAPKIDMEAAEEMQKKSKDAEVLASAQKKLDDEAREKQRQYDKDVAALRKEGYTDELIAVILPTINNGQ